MMDTYFAPAGRDSPEELQRRVTLVENTPLLKMMMDAISTPVLILNENRQILAANQALLRCMLMSSPGLPSSGSARLERTRARIAHPAPDKAIVKNCTTKKTPLPSK